MLPSTIHTAPSIDSFTSLSDHQSQTPSTFYGAKPVLHYHAVGARAISSRNHVIKLPIFPQSSDAIQAANGEAGTDQGEVGDGTPIEALVDVFISSENVTLYNQTNSTGIVIPYPSISLHAIQRLEGLADSSQQTGQGLYMQLELPDPYGVSDDDESEAIELTLVPPTASGGPTSTASDIQTMFAAVSNCSNLHPDPTFEDDEDMDDEGGDSRIIFEGNVGYEGISGLPGVQQGAADGGLPPPFPGSGGWITAENVSQYFDEEGNWIGGVEGESLGDGAGRVRSHDEVDEEGVNGHGGEDDEHKRPRTD